ncbi:MAG: phosphatidate cytidylyltransferase, partial [Planctomycetota bacterium]
PGEGHRQLPETQAQVRGPVIGGAMKKRALYGGILALGVLALLAADYRWRIDALFVGVVTAISIAGFIEFALLLRKREIPVFVKSGALFCGLLVIAMYLACGGDRAAFWAVPGILLLALFYWLARSAIREGTTPIVGASASMLGLAYIGLSIGSLFPLRAEGTGSEGTVMVVATVAAIKLGDIVAYLVGVSLGKHKLAPVISPNKTVEGLIGQLAAGALAGFVLLAVVWQVYPAGAAALFGLVVSAAGGAGDLAESKLKRMCAVKDSGNAFSAFGGVLDLLDSVLLGVPVAYALTVLYRWMGI